MAKELSVTRSQPIISGSQFVKAASGVAYAGQHLYVIQDSSRFLAKLSPALTGDIELLRLAPQEQIDQLEDPRQPYDDFRKDRRADFEAITTLPDGRLLILGSGYDAHNIGKKVTYRNIGVLFDTKTKSYTELNLEHFYQHLVRRENMVGLPHDSLQPRLNIEGVTIFEGQIAFFHRSNYAKNYHDTMISFDLEAWLKEVTANKEWTIKEKKLVRFEFGSISWNGKDFPITLNDAVYVNGELIIPIACETDMVIDGKDIDGDVIWTGVARINLKTNSCETYKFSDPKLPKVEGIAIDPMNPGHFVLVHDVDSETTPSLLSHLYLSLQASDSL